MKIFHYKLFLLFSLDHNYPSKLSFLTPGISYPVSKISPYHPLSQVLSLSFSLFVTAPPPGLIPPQVSSFPPPPMYQVPKVSPFSLLIYRYVFSPISYPYPLQYHLHSIMSLHVKFHPSRQYHLSPQSPSSVIYQHYHHFPCLTQVGTKSPPHLQLQLSQLSTTVLCNYREAGFLLLHISGEMLARAADSCCRKKYGTILQVWKEYCADLVTFYKEKRCRAAFLLAAMALPVLGRGNMQTSKAGPFWRTYRCDDL